MFSYPMFPTLHLSQTEIVNGMKKIKAPNFAKLTYLRARAALKGPFTVFGLCARCFSLEVR